MGRWVSVQAGWHEPLEPQALEGGPAEERQGCHLAGAQGPPPLRQPPSAPSAPPHLRRNTGVLNRPDTRTAYIVYVALCASVRSSLNRTEVGPPAGPPPSITSSTSTSTSSAIASFLLCKAVSVA